MNFGGIFKTDEEFEDNGYVSSKNSGNTTVRLYEPTDFDATKEIAAAIKQGDVVLMNLHNMPKAYNQRVIDFLTGVVYALDGYIEKVGHNLILCVPQNVGLSGEITLGA